MRQLFFVFAFYVDLRFDPVYLLLEAKLLKKFRVIGEVIIGNEHTLMFKALDAVSYTHLVNVENIAEELGGGGHSNMAAAVLKTKSKEEAIAMVKRAIDKNR